MIHPHRSKSHLAFVRGRACVFCPRPACEAHHAFRSAGGGGMGIKGCDLFTVPLCRPHHRELHKRGTVGERDPCETQSEMWRAIALQLRERLLEGLDPKVCWHCLGTDKEGESK